MVCVLTIPPTPIATAQPPAGDPVPLPMASVLPRIGDTDDQPAALPPGLADMPVPAVGPPPPAVLNSPGLLNIPTVALKAYLHADRLMAASTPGCGLGWNLLAGIGHIESTHAFGGATDSHGNPVEPINGPTLDGSLPGNEIIVQDQSGGRTVYARAIGPMQFLPDTWSIYTSDGDGDGRADPQNLFDAALGAARYLCDGGLNLRDRSQLITAVLRYNNSMAYTLNVLGWATAYATGSPPVSLPPLTGPTWSSGTGRAVRNPGVGAPAPAAPPPIDPAITNVEILGNAPIGGGPAAVQSPPSSGSSAGSGAAVTNPFSGGAGSSVIGGTGSSPRVTIGNGRSGGAR
ncbi:MAG: lytic murein transglycosylase [Mycobacterium sp.]|nr:lytic murein transglycosylase [Mycobacterium sp.]